MHTHVSPGIQNIGLSCSCRISVWDRATRGRADGLWEAAAGGKVSKDAFELHNKAATWSSTTKSFELDLLEVMRQSVLKALSLAFWL